MCDQPLTIPEDPSICETLNRMTFASAEVDIFSLISLHGPTVVVQCCVNVIQTTADPARQAVTIYGLRFAPPYLAADAIERLRRHFRDDHFVCHAALQTLRALMISTCQKTILVLDLVGYSAIAAAYQQGNGAAWVASLNEQIQGFIDSALATLRLPRLTTVLKTTGDGAILVFEKSEIAHTFAEQFYQRTAQHNAGRTESSALRRFRVGIATGEISIAEDRDGRFDAAGVPIAVAVRLEGGARPGECVIDETTYSLLPTRLRRRYGGQEMVHGKRQEVFPCHRCLMDTSSPLDQIQVVLPLSRAQPSNGSRRAIVTLLNDLWPAARLDLLMYLVRMPVTEQPPPLLPHDSRAAMVLTWSQGPTGCGLPTLEAELRYLLDQKSSPGGTEREADSSSQTQDSQIS